MKTNQVRILAVDDELPFLDLMQEYFGPRGIEVVCASKCEDAIRRMKRDKFPVVVLDYQMPQIKGDDLIGNLQHIHPEAKFIIVTGQIEANVEEKFRGLGYFGFFNKGNLSFKELEATVREALENGGA